MKIQVKPGVVFKELIPQLFHVCMTVDSVYKKYGVTPTITSANDSQHMVGSYHYTNMAWDLRVWGITNVTQVVEELKALLNLNRHEFDVIFERDHIHVEYDPK